MKVLLSVDEYCHLIGYIYYSDGSRREAVHFSGSSDADRRSSEQSTARSFAFAQHNTASWSSVKPTRYEVVRD